MDNKIKCESRSEIEMEVVIKTHEFDAIKYLSRACVQKSHETEYLI